MRLWTKRYRKTQGRGWRRPKLLKAASASDLRPMLASAHLVKDKDGYWLVATDGYIMVKVPVNADIESDDMPVEGPIPRSAMKHIDALPLTDKGQADATFAAREDAVEVGPEVSYRRRDLGGQPPDFEKVMGDATDIKKPLRIAFNAELLKNAADALGTDALEVTIDLDNLDHPEGKFAQYLKPLLLHPRGEADGRVALVMPIRIDV